MSTLDVAIIGAGPAGIYASAILHERAQAEQLDARVDVFEALAAPYGLIRYGVAPDHPRIKGIVDSLEEMLANPRTRLFANVTVGRDISVAELLQRYDAVVVATGADRDALTDLPGADLPGCHGAADFVAWYDGHPDRARSWNLDAARVAVLGNGNVALDVARVLAKETAHLISTDIPDNVLSGVATSQVRDIHVFGRRGPAQAKFTPIELRELGEIDGVEIVLDPRDFTLAEQDAAWSAPSTNQQRIIRRIFESWLTRPPRPAARRIHLHFWCAPVRVLGERSVEGVEFRRTAPDGVAPEATVTYPAQAVYRAIGYRSDPVPGVPYDAVHGRILHDGGRVHDPAGNVLARLYTTGWAKRGPVGLIGHTKSDARETVDALVHDVLANPRAVPARGSEAIATILAEHGVDAVTWDGWLRLDEHERALGSRYPGDIRARVKVVDRGEQLRLAQLPPASDSGVTEGDAA